MSDQPPIEIEPQAEAKYSIIWLHGLGADGSDFVPIVAELNLPMTSNVRYIFPHAPIIPVTINNGQRMRAWFDIRDLSENSFIDITGINNACDIIKKLVRHEESRGISSDHIILAGFSQGAAIALATAIRYEKPLGGVIALSGFLPQALMQNTVTHLPIFLAHGINDNVVPYAFGKMTYVNLKQIGFSVEWHSYAMQHTVCEPEINDISTWIQKTWR